MHSVHTWKKGRTQPNPVFEEELLFEPDPLKTIYPPHEQESAPEDNHLIEEKLELVPIAPSSSSLQTETEGFIPGHEARIVYFCKTFSSCVETESIPSTGVCEAQIMSPKTRPRSSRPRVVEQPPFPQLFMISTKDDSPDIAIEPDNATEPGTIARNGRYCPLHYKDWRLMPYSYKDEMLKKSYVKSLNFDPDIPIEQQKLNIDDCVEHKQYITLIEHWMYDKSKKINDKNRENPAQLELLHCMGKKSFALLKNTYKGLVYVLTHRLSPLLIVLSKTFTNSELFSLWIHILYSTENKHEMCLNYRNIKIQTPTEHAQPGYIIAKINGFSSPNSVRGFDNQYCVRASKLIYPTNPSNITHIIVYVISYVCSDMHKAVSHLPNLSPIMDGVFILTYVP
ncbi:hypothetical protein Pfo_005308 [Paulownia fortunei]|nr:hypothetical protein Pfo_005308 [Paulownia fortunei]